MELYELISDLYEQEQLASIEELIQDFENYHSEEFFEKYRELLNGYADAEEYERELRQGEVHLGTLLVWNMVDQGILLQLDWDGESEENETAEFVNYRLEALGIEGAVNTEEVYELFRQNQQKKHSIYQEGDFLPILFRHINKQIGCFGCRLLIFDTQSDQYYIGVFEASIAWDLMNALPSDISIYDPEEIC